MSVTTVSHTVSRQREGTKDLCAERNPLHGGSGNNRYTAAQFNTNLHETIMIICVYM
jgi:hypothetical protein